MSQSCRPALCQPCPSQCSRHFWKLRSLGLIKKKNKQTSLGGSQADIKVTTFSLTPLCRFSHRQVSHLHPSNLVPSSSRTTTSFNFSNNLFHLNGDLPFCPQLESFLNSVCHISSTLHLTHGRIHHCLVTSQMTPLFCLLHVLALTAPNQVFLLGSYDTSFGTLSLVRPTHGPKPPLFLLPLCLSVCLFVLTHLC